MNTYYIMQQWDSMREPVLHMVRAENEDQAWFAVASAVWEDDNEFSVIAAFES